MNRNKALPWSFINVLKNLNLKVFKLIRACSPIFGLGMVKRAPKRCNLFCNIAAKEVEK